jgi:hypothetical protein
MKSEMESKGKLKEKIKKLECANKELVGRIARMKF